WKGWKSAMKWEEERIREQFQRQREEDERNAPSFAHTWNGALALREKPRRRQSLWRLAGAAALILLAAGWWMFFRQSTKRQAPIEIGRSGTPAPRVTAPPVSQAPAPVKNPPDLTRRRPFARPQTPPILISQWRSPTEFLLRTPGEQFF